MTQTNRIRSSRQIRPPIYSLKQSKLRRRRVIRFSILYFTMLVLFIVLFFGPLIIRRFLFTDEQMSLNLLDGEFIQPTGQDNNDTTSEETGTGSPNYGETAAADLRMFF